MRETSRQSLRPDWAWAVLFAASIVGFPFVSLLPTFLGVPSRPISIAFRAAVVLLALGILTRWLLGRTLLRSGPSVWALLGFWSLLLGRISWEATVVPLPLNLVWGEYYLFGIGVALVPCLALLEIPSRVTIRLALRLTEVMGVPAVAGLSYAGFMVVMSGEMPVGRLGTETVNAAYIGYIGVIVATVSIISMVYARRDGSSKTWTVGVRLFSVLMGLVAMVASASKGPVLVGLATAILLLMLRVGGPRTTKGVTWRLGLLLAVTVGAGLTAVLLEEYTTLETLSRFSNVLADESTLERTQMLAGAFEQFAQNPLVGDDIVELKSQTYPHNLLLESLMTTGVLGFVAFCVIIAISARDATWLFFAHDGREWLSLIYVQFWLLGLIAGSLVFTPHVWAATTAVLGAAGAFRIGGGDADHAKDAISA